MWPMALTDGVMRLGNARIQLLLLTIGATTGIYARTTVGPLQETIRVALALSDNQMALLQGPALALPLLVGAIPLGLAIDRFSRVRVLFVATAINLVGSLFTAIAPSFATLFAARCLVGLAAPATAIAAYSLVADLFAPAQRGRATMVVVLGQVAGSAAAFALGGELLSTFGSRPDGWRLAMLWMASLHVPVILLLLAMREPLRLDLGAEKPTVRDTWPALWRYRAVIATLLGGMALVGFADGAALVWSAPTISRRFGLSVDQIGAVMAIVLLVSGIAGPIAGGFLADVSNRAGGPRQAVSMLIGIALLSVPLGVFAVMPTVATMTLPLTLFLASGAAINVAVTALAVVVLPNQLRGICMAMFWAVGGLFGLALAPLAVSSVSGSLGGTHTIAKALAFVAATTSVFGVAVFVLGRRYFPTTTFATERDH